MNDQMRFIQLQRDAISALRQAANLLVKANNAVVLLRTGQPTLVARLSDIADEAEMLASLVSGVRAPSTGPAHREDEWTLDGLGLRRQALLDRARANLRKAEDEWHNDDERFPLLRTAINRLRNQITWTAKELEDTLPWGMLAWRDELAMTIGEEGYLPMHIAQAERRNEALGRALDKVRGS